MKFDEFEIGREPSDPDCSSWDIVGESSGKSKRVGGALGLFLNCRSHGVLDSTTSAEESEMTACDELRGVRSGG